MRKLKGVLDKSSDKEKMMDQGRDIFVQGCLDDALVSTLTPQILALRKNSQRPITVFIDSIGGNIEACKVLLGLLKTPDQMGRTCLINTVVTGRACSSAAYLLASGDYIVSYPKVYDTSWRIIYYVEIDRVYTNSWSLAYHLEENKVYDPSWRLVARIDGDRIYSEDWALLYRIDGDRIYDLNWRLVYYVEDR